MKTIVVKKDVGYLVIADFENGKSNVYIEEDMGVNCHGDPGNFYRDSTADIVDGGICYVEEVPTGILHFNSPDFERYAYTYNDILLICYGYSDAVKQCLELANGNSIQAIWESIKDNYL